RCPSAHTGAEGVNPGQFKQGGILFMSSQKTEHYELNQWLATDQVLRTDFNADNAKIDAALAGLAETDTALWAAVQKCGNCKIVRVPFTGNGFVQVNISFPQK